MEIIVISIGVLSKNPLWGERTAVRSSHATTTLVKSGKALVLIDPSLPPELLEPRLHERSGIFFDKITHIFLTNWRPVHRRSLERFPRAAWYLHQTEIDAVTAALKQARENALGEEAAAILPLIQKEETLLEKIEAAPDEIAEGLGLFPLPGYTPGQCGLIATEPTLTTLIAGDAVPTAGHFAAGQILPDSWDMDKAKESMVELLEVADVIIPGHDNLFVSRRGTGM